MVDCTCEVVVGEVETAPAKRRWTRLTGSRRLGRISFRGRADQGGVASSMVWSVDYAAHAARQCCPSRCLTNTCDFSSACMALCSRRCQARPGGSSQCRCGLSRLRATRCNHPPQPVRQRTWADGALGFHVGDVDRRDGGRVGGRLGGLAAVAGEGSTEKRGHLTPMLVRSYRCAKALCQIHASGRRWACLVMMTSRMQMVVGG